MTNLHCFHITISSFCIILQCWVFLVNNTSVDTLRNMLGSKKNVIYFPNPQPIKPYQIAKQIKQLPIQAIDSIFIHPSVRQHSSFQILKTGKFTLNN